MKARKSFRAFKAFNRDLTCREFQYQEGETYDYKGKIGLCQRGFHFCKDLVLTLEYYPAKISIVDNKYAEVEILGDVEFEQPTKHKGVTNKMRIVRVLDDSEVMALVNGNCNSGDCNSGDCNSGNSNSGDCNSGDNNSGYSNSGNCNSGYSNSGYSNSGDCNSGNSNSGYNNSGDNNSGYSNSGYNNSGNSNSGYRNSGNSNSGNCNSGDCNSSSQESGHFNSRKSEFIRVFNNNCTRKAWDNADKPDFIYFSQEDGLTYKEAFLVAWNNASADDRMKVSKLPNFDNDVFLEISGIDFKKMIAPLEGGDKS